VCACARVRVYMHLFKERKVFASVFLKCLEKSTNQAGILARSVASHWG